MGYLRAFGAAHGSNGEGQGFGSDQGIELGENGDFRNHRKADKEVVRDRERGGVESEESVERGGLLRLLHLLRG